MAERTFQRPFVFAPRELFFWFFRPYLWELARFVAKSSSFNERWIVIDLDTEILPNRHLIYFDHDEKDFHAMNNQRNLSHQNCYTDLALVISVWRYSEEIYSFGIGIDFILSVVFLSSKVFRAVLTSSA